MNARQLIQFESISMIPTNINLKCVLSLLCTIDKSQLISATTFFFGGGGSSHGRPHAMTKIAGEVHKKNIVLENTFLQSSFLSFVKL